MNIGAMLSHLKSGKKMRRKSWDSPNSCIAECEINCYGYNIKRIHYIHDYKDKDGFVCVWSAEYDELYADDWEVVNEECNCSEKCEVCTCNEKYYTTSEIAKEFNLSANEVYKILTRDRILEYNPMKKCYIMIDKENEKYVNYKVNYKISKCFRLKWNEKGKKKLTEYLKAEFC